MVKWFILENDIVSGPLNTEQLKGRIEEDYVDKTSLIWGNGLEAWSTIDDWQSRLSELKASQVIAPENIWHYAINRESFGPLTRHELIKKLSLINTQNNDVLIWTKGMEEWLSLFECHDLVMDLGIEVRRHPRQDIEGKVYLIKDNIEILGELKSISQGGLGIQGIRSLTAGQEVLMDLESPSLGRKKFRVKAKVKYISGEFYAGLQFESVGAETKSAIIEFIKMSQESSKAAA
jgi:hypothetical protein